jgi:hypothetical protein
VCVEIVSSPLRAGRLLSLEKAFQFQPTQQPAETIRWKSGQTGECVYWTLCIVTYAKFGANTNLHF